MNPYDFVTPDWGIRPQREQGRGHDTNRYITGKFYGTITLERPAFIPLGNNKKTFARDKNNRAIFPGSSLKGLFRSVFETLNNCCFAIFEGNYSDNTNFALPNGFSACSTSDSLCPACQLFGFLNRGDVISGRVGFDDAVCIEENNHDYIWTPILSAPKPRHSAFYKKDNKPAGRKFYHHHLHGIKTLSNDRNGQNQQIRPLDAGSVFKFTGFFNDIKEEELNKLLFAVTLTKNDRHMLGYAKPAGLGSARITVDKLLRIDMGARYRGESGSRQVLEGEQLAKLLNAVIENNVDNALYQQLHKIWQWPAIDQPVSYPDRDWFNNNPHAPLNKTP